MPRKSDSIAINNPKHDKRVKLTDTDKEQIKKDRELGSSIHGLSKQYGVSRRSIQFILYPERLEKSNADFAERRKDGRYYDKDKHKEYVKAHRNHKKELHNAGLLDGKEQKTVDTNS